MHIINAFDDTGPRGFRENLRKLRCVDPESVDHGLEAFQRGQLEPARVAGFAKRAIDLGQHSDETL
jgi:hypothetical protein